MAEESLKYKTKKGLYWKFLDQFFNYGMSFVVGIVMARMLSPEDYGITALPAVFISVAEIFINGSFSNALVRKETVTEKDLSTSFYYSILMGIFMYLCLFFAAPWIAQFYDKPILTSLVRVTALTFLWGPLATPQNVILQRKLDFKTPTRVSIVNKIVGAIVGVAMAYTGYGLWALVVSSLVSNLLGLIQTWLVVRWVPKERFSKESFQYLWNYGNKLIAVGLLNTLYANIVPLIVGKSSGTKDLGNLNRAKNFASIPSSNIAGVITGVTFPILSRLQGDDENFNYNYRRMLKFSSFVVFPIMLLLAALSRPLVLFLITAKWEPCIILLQVMCFTYMFQPMQILNLFLLQVKGRTDLSLKVEIFKKIAGAVVFISAACYCSVLNICIIDFFYTMFALVVNTYYTGKIIEYGYIRQIKDIMPSFLLSLSMFIIVIIMNSFFENLMIQLVVGTILGLIIYIGSSMFFQKDEIKDAIYMLSRRK